MKARNRIVWGILLVLAGVLIALSALDILNLPFDISLWRIILGGLVLCVMLDGIVKLDFVQFFLMLAVEVMIFEPALGILLDKTEENWISNWTVLLIAVLLGIGFDMLFKGVKGKYKGKRIISIDSISDHLHYIDSASFEKKYLKNHFGDMEIRFENVDEYKGCAVLTIENSFGDVTIYVPATWEVKNELSNVFGDIKIDHELTVHYVDGSAKILYIKGSNKFGDVSVKAVS